MSDDLYRREFLGRPAAPRIEDTHPFPWRVRRHVSPGFPTAGGYRERSEVWIILDANGKHVTECDAPHVAHIIVETMNADYQRRRPVLCGLFPESDPKGVYWEPCNRPSNHQGVCVNRHRSESKNTPEVGDVWRGTAQHKHLEERFLVKAVEDGAFQTNTGTVIDACSFTNGDFEFVRSGPLTLCPTCAGPLLDMRGYGFFPDHLDAEGKCYRWAEDRYRCLGKKAP